jgi:hypothetical protein
MKKQTAVEWFEYNLKDNLGKIVIKQNWQLLEDLIEQAKDMEKKEKLKYQLFIGKVMEIIGDEKTIKLLRECYETFKSK